MFLKFNFNNYYNSKKIYNEDLFCNYLRKNKQYKIIKLTKRKKFLIEKLNLNWDYISLYDNLTIDFINYFDRYINFYNLSSNKNLTSKHISIFCEKLNWIKLSKYYNFSIEELKKYDKYIKWEYIFFFNNNCSDDYKVYFNQHMWWLFLNDNINTDISNEYYKYNNKILNNNIKNYPNNLIEIFNFKLAEYNNNKIILKNILKKQLLKLYTNYDDYNQITNLTKIKCYNLDKSNLKHKQTQTNF